MPANESVVYYDHNFESSTTVNLMIELVTLVLIIFAGISINYKRRQQRLRSSIRDEHADETVPTSAEADKQIGSRAKRQFIKKCDREFLDCVSECVKNVIKVTFH